MEVDVWALIDDEALVAAAHEDVELVSEVEIFKKVDILDVDRSDTSYLELTVKP